MFIDNKCDYQVAIQDNGENLSYTELKDFCDNFPISGRNLVFFVV